VAPADNRSDPGCAQPQSAVLASFSEKYANLIRAQVCERILSADTLGYADRVVGILARCERALDCDAGPHDEMPGEQDQPARPPGSAL